MAKRIVFLTSERIAGNAAESIHLYKRIVSFRNSADITVITQSSDMHPEQAGCKQVVHIDSKGGNQDTAVSVAKQADMFVVVGMAPNTNPSASLLSKTRPECCIAVINKGCMDLPDDIHREHVLTVEEVGCGYDLRVVEPDLPGCFELEDDEGL